MWLFFKEALKDFITQGSLFPSSPFLAKKMLQPLVLKKGVRVVELGAGGGAFTLELLSRMPADSQLIVFELNPAFAQHLRKIIKDSRVMIIEDDARRLGHHLEQLHIHKADYILSGLPIGNFNRAMRQEILLAIHDNLSDTGRYVQFQYFLANWRHIKSIFDTKVIGYEIRNVPPAFVYECKKYTQSRAL
jgi:phospholipid N-methyltransferase